MPPRGIKYREKIKRKQLFCQCYNPQRRNRRQSSLRSATAPNAFCNLCDMDKCRFYWFRRQQQRESASRAALMRPSSRKRYRANATLIYEIGKDHTNPLDFSSSTLLQVLNPLTNKRKSRTPKRVRFADESLIEEEKEDERSCEWHRLHEQWVVLHLSP